MFHPVSLFVGMRYGRARQSGAFVSFITLFSVAGILLGVAALITVISVMNGFENELKQRILGVVPHIEVEHDAEKWDWQQALQRIKAHPKVVSAKPYIDAQAMIQSPGQLHGVLMQGVFPEQEQDSIIERNMPYGSLADLQAGNYGVVLGVALARKLDVTIGDKIRLVVPEASVFTPVGRMPSQRNFRVIGVYQLGSAIDESVVLIHGNDARRMLRMPEHKISAIRVSLNDAFSARAVANQLAPMLSAGTQIKDWSVSQGKLFEAVKMEKNMIWLMLSLIVAVAAFNIVSALVMVVMDKQGEISILQTLGMTPGKIMQIFIVQGVYHGLIGTVLGTAIGVALAANLNEIMAALNLNLLATYPGQGLPVVMSAGQIVGIGVSALALSFSATLYPAWRASKNIPAETLRYE